MKKILFSIILVLTFLFGLTYVYAEENNTVVDGNENFPNIVEGVNNNDSQLTADIPRGPTIDSSNDDEESTTVGESETPAAVDETNVTTNIEGSDPTTVQSDTNSTSISNEPVNGEDANEAGSSNETIPSEPSRGGEVNEPTRAGEENGTTTQDENGTTTQETIFVKYNYTDSNGNLKQIVTESGRTVTLSQMIQKYELAETLTTITGVTSSNPEKVTITKQSNGDYNIVSADDYAQSGIICTAQGTGTLTFTCKTIPNVDLTLNVVCF